MSAKIFGDRHRLRAQLSLFHLLQFYPNTFTQYFLLLRPVHPIDRLFGTFKGTHNHGLRREVWEACSEYLERQRHASVNASVTNPIDQVNQQLWLKDPRRTEIRRFDSSIDVSAPV